MNSSSKTPSGNTISQTLAEFVAGYDAEAIPKQVRERAKHLVLDAIGIAFASTFYDFPHRTLTGLTAVAGSGDATLIGLTQRLPLRDAVLMNGLLIHGLDYDDTHVEAIVHPTASAFPCALGVGESLDISGDKLLAAYILGVEVSTRLGLAARGRLHHYGFHPTGIAAHFACALQAGWLNQLNAHQLTMAQGIVGSTASGSQEFLEEGAWNKRIHPGWAGYAGITAAALARNGFMGPSKVYEGRFGLYKSHLHADEEQIDYGLITANLGKKWEVVETSIKPFPICHLIHACADAALEIRKKQKLDYRNVAEVTALLPQETLQIVAEPPENKIKPANSYDGKFSTQYVVANCLVHGRFGLADLENNALTDPEVLALAAKVKCVADPDTLFPKFFSGSLIVKTRDGREYRHDEPVNRGCGDRAISETEIEAKFMENAQMVIPASRARKIRDHVLKLDQISARELCAVLKA